MAVAELSEHGVSKCVCYGVAMILGIVYQRDNICLITTVVTLYEAECCTNTFFISD